jgi:NAD(P)-dependent dehydrogenase (short-subunit alcohol dehydrogenase family)
LQRGAEVVLACRSQRKAQTAIETLRDEFGAECPVTHLPLDLSDLSSVRESANLLAERLGDQRIDVVVCNAGLWPRRYSASPQGHELAFATNVLGHHALLRELMRGTLADAGRIVMLTGDIYALASDCSPDYRYHTPFGGMLAYCRSKLGNLWLADQLRTRAPEFSVVAVHPGVVASNLGGRGGSLARLVRRRIMIDVERGAQASVYACCAQDLPADAYLHNTLGLIELRKDDAARDTAKAERLWETCERLVRDHAISS